MENIFAGKSAGFYSKDIEELPDKWQQDIENNGEYMIEENVILLYILKKNKSYR